MLKNAHLLNDTNKSLLIKLISIASLQTRFRKISITRKTDNQVMMNKNILISALMIVNIIVLFWSVNYLISYAAQDKVASIGYAIIFSTAFYSINVLVIKLIKDK